MDIEDTVRTCLGGVGDRFVFVFGFFFFYLCVFCYSVPISMRIYVCRVYGFFGVYVGVFGCVCLCLFLCFCLLGVPVLVCLGF